MLVRDDARAARLAPVAGAAAALLRQCADFVTAVGDEAYTRESATIRGGTIGKHVRHVLDHFRAALDASATGVIDYDHRERNVPMETDRAAAAAAIEHAVGRLALLGPDELGATVAVRVMLAADGTCAELRSTLGRELAFAAHHAVHHHAMLKAIAAEFGVEAGPGFGTAPSTLNHHGPR